MKPASSPNWLEYDKSGKVVGRRFYSTDPAPVIPDHRPSILADDTILIGKPHPPLDIDPVEAMAVIADAMRAKPPRPRRAK